MAALTTTTNLVDTPGFQGKRTKCAASARKPSIMQTHAPSCQRRKIECPVRKCLHQVSVEDVCKHMMDEHARTTMFSATDNDTIFLRFPINHARTKGPHNSFDHSWIFNGKRFFARLQQVYPTWFAWVYVLGEKSVAEKYRCKITMLNNEDEEIRMSYSGPIHSVEVPKREIRSTHARCLQLTEDCVGKMMGVGDISKEEELEGFNAAVRIRFRVEKRE